MKTILFRIIGVALIIASIGAMLFSIIGLVYVWPIKNSINTSLIANLDLASSTLQTTSQGLAVADTSLNTSISSIQALQSTVIEAGSTLSNTIPVVDTFTTLANNDLPTTISNVQNSLVAAQDTAKIIDTVLKALTSIPFVSKDLYNPPVPFDVALKQVSDSLNTVPPALSTMATSLSASKGNLEKIKIQSQIMGSTLVDIQKSVESARDVVKQYQDLATDLDARITRAKLRVPAMLNSAAWVVTFILLWAAVVQFGFLIQGWDLLHREV